MIKPAAYFRTSGAGALVCELCPLECHLTEGKTGICGSRFNRGGELFTDNYAELVTFALDPIEKKPLYHFYPGSSILSTGPNCCNLGCLNCQNWTISQEKSPTLHFTPERLLQSALDHRSLGVAFTYSEPMIWFEYIMDVAPLLRAAGLKTVLVTNGFINPKPLERLLSVTDAMNVDLKSIREQFYRHICKGELQPVLDTIRQIASSPVHLELTNLVIPGENDSDSDLSDLIDFVASVSVSIPLHFSAYHPDFKMNRPPTPVATLNHARQLAVTRLQYVYLGNVVSDGADTHCPSCKALLIRRKGFRVTIEGLEAGLCKGCGFETGIRQ
ncbi:MAG: AmmeMemoRadiSam system radical SAM enzyme [bacterium]|nr:AmmeMemoRadiSam system radical SAM enzyme [bacterium]